jgi:hypothetical protein
VTEHPRKKEKSKIFSNVAVRTLEKKVEQRTILKIMLALINPTVLPALRIAATFFFIVNLVGGAYIFRNRHRFFDRDPNVDNDIPAMRKLRVEVVMVPWFVLTTLILILLIGFWLA